MRWPAQPTCCNTWSPVTAEPASCSAEERMAKAARAVEKGRQSANRRYRSGCPKATWCPLIFAANRTAEPDGRLRTRHADLTRFTRGKQRSVERRRAPPTCQIQRRCDTENAPRRRIPRRGISTMAKAAKGGRKRAASGNFRVSPKRGVGRPVFAYCGSWSLSLGPQSLPGTLDLWTVDRFISALPSQILTR